MNIKLRTLSLALISVILTGLGYQGCSVTSKGKTDVSAESDTTTKHEHHTSLRLQHQKRHLILKDSFNVGYFWNQLRNQTPGIMFLQIAT